MAARTIPDKPKVSCSVCGCTEWWLLGARWVCGRCHPNPNNYKKSQFIYLDNGIFKKGEW